MGKRIRVFVSILLFVLVSGCAHHIVNGVEVTLPEPDKDRARSIRF